MREEGGLREKTEKEKVSCLIWMSSGVDDMEHASLKSKQTSVPLQYGYCRLLHCLATVFV